MFEAADVALHDLASDHPSVTYRHAGEAHRLDCDYVAGCDGYYGVSRASLPEGFGRVFERVYPSAGWVSWRRWRPAIPS